jgi:phenylpyruvate tautomerase PptA (4-oxalocrotonate tautomerase family)
MPILDVEVVGDVPPMVREGLAQRLADAAGEALASRPQGTWVKLRFLDPPAYAENGGAAGGVRPVFVRVLQHTPPSGEARAEEAARLTRAVARACGREPEHVHLLYEAAARGRIAFGGELRT